MVLILNHRKRVQKKRSLVIDNGIILFKDDISTISYNGQIERLKANCTHHVDKNGRAYLLAPRGLSVTNKIFIND